MKRLFFIIMCVCGGKAFALPSNCVVNTNVYYISQAGVDTNTQAQAKSKTTPWKHAPAMHSFTGTYTHTAGDCFVFRGNDTWNVGTTDYFIVSSGGSSASNTDYYGVDITWFSGASWTRPIMDVQSSFPNTDAFHNSTVFSLSVPYVTFDNFEVIHAACQATPTQTNMTIFSTNAHDYITVTNSYFHNFTSQLGGCGGGKVTNGSASGNNFAVWIYMSVSSDGGHGSFDHNVVDGSDGTGVKGYETIVMDPGTAAIPSYNVLHDICSGVAGLMNSVHDNLIYNFGRNVNGVNGFDCVNTGVHAHAIRTQADANVYNNVVHDANDGIIKTNPTNGNMYYIFNNVTYHNGYTGFTWYQIDECDNGSGSCTNGKVTVFNNSLECNEPAGAACFRLENAMNTLILENEHHVSSDNTGTNLGTNLATTFTTNNNVYQQSGTCAGCADANASPKFDQYTLSQTNVISPVASTNSTVGAGTAVPSGAPSAAKRSTTYACLQGTVSGVVQVVCPALTANSRGATPDAGAYLFQASGPSFTVSPSAIPANHSTNIILTLTGTGTSWTSSTAFTASGVTGITFGSCINTSATAETCKISTGSPAGTLTITDVTDSISTAINIVTASIVISPTSASPGTGGCTTTCQTTLTLTGTDTLWSTDITAGNFTASTLFGESGGTGASLSGCSITSNTAATCTLQYGSAAATETITDNSTTATATFTVATPALPTVTTGTAAIPVSISTLVSTSSYTCTGSCSAVTSEGICYSTASLPTLPCTSNGIATPFNSTLTLLFPNTTYNYRAFATNSAGTAYGSVASFTTPAVLYVDGGGGTSNTSSNTFTFTYAPVFVNDAITFGIYCHGASIPTSATLTASGWTISTLVNPTSNGLNAAQALFGAIAPNTNSTTFTVAFFISGSTPVPCSSFYGYMIGEFMGNNTAGGVNTFATTGASGASTGGCNQIAGNITPTSNNNAIWDSCFDAPTAANSPWTIGAIDGTGGDVSEYQLLTGGMGVAQTPNYAGTTGVYIVLGTTITSTGCGTGTGTCVPASCAKNDVAAAINSTYGGTGGAGTAIPGDTVALPACALDSNLINTMVNDGANNITATLQTPQDTQYAPGSTICIVNSTVGGVPTGTARFNGCYIVSTSNPATNTLTWVQTNGNNVAHSADASVGFIIGCGLLDNAPSNCWGTQLDVTGAINFKGQDAINANAICDPNGLLGTATQAGCGSAGVSNTIIVDAVPKGAASCAGGAPAFKIEPTTTIGWRFSAITIQGAAYDNFSCSRGHLSVAGGSQALRIDNITFANAQTNAVPTNGYVMGVVDHVTITSWHNQLALVGEDQWCGLGTYFFGDGSWFCPNTAGTVQQMVFENILCSIKSASGVNCIANDGNGGRWTIRYSIVTSTGGHGTESPGRARSMRKVEAYGNLFTDVVGGVGQTGLGTMFGQRGGSGLVFNNTATTSQSGNYVAATKMDNFRDVQNNFSNWGGCSGIQDGSLQVAAGETIPWDNTDGVLYGSGSPSTAYSDPAAGTASQLIDSAQNSNSLWANNGLLGYSVLNTTAATPWIAVVVSSQTSGSTTTCSATAPPAIACSGPDTSGNHLHSWALTDTYNIRKAYPCLDQVGRGSGPLLIAGTTAKIATGYAGAGHPGWTQEISEPDYMWSNTRNGTNVFGVADTAEGGNGHIQQCRDWYDDSANACGVSSQGVTAGLLSARPATCTPSVGYWATDKSILYQCSSTNTWTIYYQPLVYPYPFILSSTSGGQGFVLSNGAIN